jgi:hypothetical protein
VASDQQQQQQFEGFVGDSFVVRSAFVGTDYVIMTGDGQELLWTRRQYFDEETEYRYLDESDTIRYQYLRQERGSFRLVDGDTETLLATVEHEEEPGHWAVTTPAGDRVVLVGETRRVSLFRTQRGRTMRVLDDAGTQIGESSARLLALRFTFDIDLAGVPDSLKGPVVLAVPMLYDVMQEYSTEFRG